MATGSYLLVITLNVNGLNAPTKRQRLAEWIQKQDPYICCLQETHLKTGDTYRLKVKGWKKIFHANWDQKKAGVTILVSDKLDFKTKAVKRDKEGHYIMIKGSIQEEDITIINIYAPNIGALQYVRQILTSMKGEINNNTIIVGDVNTPLTPMLFESPWPHSASAATKVPLSESRAPRIVTCRESGSIGHVNAARERTC